MTRMRKALAAAALAALIAPAAVVAALSNPALADADGKHRHDLDTYKREAWFEIPATGATSLHEHMSCDPNDVALDGMWKIDAHDGDDRSVLARASFADTTNISMWHYELENTGNARAQVKLFITCLDHRTGARDGHAHTLTFRDATNSGVVTPVAPGVAERSLSCVDGEIPVAPGFKFGTDAMGKIYRSYPSSDTLGWGWSFIATHAGDLNVTLRCVSRTTTTQHGHSHKVDADLIPGWHGQYEVLGLGERLERSITSRAHDEGNVGGFWINSPEQVTYLGQDARGQVRTTRFWNDVSSSGVYLTIWGFDKRTKKNP